MVSFVLVRRGVLGNKAYHSYEWHIANGTLVSTKIKFPRRVRSGLPENSIRRGTTIGGTSFFLLAISIVANVFAGDIFHRLSRTIFWRTRLTQRNNFSFSQWTFHFFSFVCYVKVLKKIYLKSNFQVRWQVSVSMLAAASPLHWFL